MNAADKLHPIIAVEDVTKTFAGVTALKNLSLSFVEGEITALVGDNGAGKSTFIKCLSGLQPPDSGRILMDGTEVHLHDPRDSRSHGIETVYQDLGLVDDLNVWENLHLSRELRRRGLLRAMLDRGRMRKHAREMLAHLGAEHRIPVNGQVRWMSGGQRQAVAIARAVSWGAKVVILDEPTAALGVNERREVHDLILRLKEKGITVILVSHNFEEIMSLADQVWVFRQGTVVAGKRGADTSAAELVTLLTGSLTPDEQLAHERDTVGSPKTQSLQRS
jgi:D-xylose transport system ATP-binding protein